MHKGLIKNTAGGWVSIPLIFCLLIKVDRISIIGSYLLLLTLW